MAYKIELAPGWAAVRDWGHIPGLEGRLVADFDDNGRFERGELPELRGAVPLSATVVAGRFGGATEALRQGVDPDPEELKADLLGVGVPHEVGTYLAGLVAKKHGTRQQQARHRPRRKPKPTTLLDATRSLELVLMLEVLLRVLRGMSVGQAIEEVATASGRSASSVRQHVGPVRRYKKIARLC